MWTHGILVGLENFSKPPSPSPLSPSHPTNGRPPSHRHNFLFPLHSEYGGKGGGEGRFYTSQLSLCYRRRGKICNPFRTPSFFAAASPPHSWVEGRKVFTRYSKVFFLFSFLSAAQESVKMQQEFLFWGYKEPSFLHLCEILA